MIEKHLITGKILTYREDSKQTYESLKYASSCYAGNYVAKNSGPYDVTRMLEVQDEDGNTFWIPVTGEFKDQLYEESGTDPKFFEKLNIEMEIKIVRK